jgi:hypothetical protein
MRVADILFVTAVACGGRIEEGPTEAGPNDSGPSDTGPLIEAGFQSGACQLDVGFTPNKMPFYPVTHVDTLSTGTRTSGTFELVCSGKAPNKYHYILDVTGITLAGGSSMGAATLVEDPDTHNPQVANGPCTITVGSITPAMIGETVSGTIACPYLLDDPIGGYTVNGAFTVPLR